MYRKLLFIEIVLALGIPALPLGALLSLSAERSQATAIAEQGRAAPAVLPVPASAGEPSAAVPALTGEPPAKRGRASPEQLALAFRPPQAAAQLATPALAGESPGQNTAGAGGKQAGGKAASSASAPDRYRGSDKFKHLGSIRDGGDREWLYLKDNESGRIIAVSAGGTSREGVGLVSADTESYVIAKDNIEYLIRRN